jgi:hypothetical protein
MADHFELTGRGLKITYTSLVRTTQGVRDLLVVEYNPLGEARSLQGDEIEQLESRIGLLLTVPLNAVPDENTLTLTLLLPEVYLTDTPEPSFDTIAVLTTIYTAFVAGPGPNPRQTYETVPLRGRARPNPF